MLTNFAHIVKVKLEHTLQFEFILEVIDHTCRITDTCLLVNCTTYQVLVDVVLQSDGRDVVYIV